MTCLNGLKRVFSCLLVAAVAITIGLLVYQFMHATGGTGVWGWSSGFKISNSKQNAETVELVRVLRKAAMNDRTVILTTLNEAWVAPGSVFDLFLESFHIGEQTEQLLRHLVVVAMDPKALERCKSLHPNCFFLTTGGIDFASEKRFMSPDYLKMMWRRLEFLKSVLELGYSFIFTDSDIMWFRNPFLHFSGSADLTIASDLFKGSATDPRNWANCGFMYAKSNYQTIEFYEYWLMAKTQYPDKNEQQIFNIIKQDSYATRLGLRVRFLDTAYFGGFCRPSKDLNKVCTMHANCCVGMENKVHDLKLLLQDWKNYTSRPEEERRVGTFSWRAPEKCSHKDIVW